YHAHIYCPEAECPAAEVAALHLCAEYADAEALERFAAAVDVITFEFENIPSASLHRMAALTQVHPSPRVLEICQHRVREKRFIQELGVGVAPFVSVAAAEALPHAVEAIGFPCVLKTCTLGYDGKGQVMLGKAEDLSKAAQLAGQAETILEGFVDFSMEISVIAARNAAGEIACFPAVQNIHENHILHQTVAPAPIPRALALEAEHIAQKIAEAIGLVGLLAVEMFVTRDSRLLVNELAPRPHNSGHWTMDACATSQFAQAVRAICGLKLGSTQRLCDATMTNLIGDDVLQWRKWLEKPNARLHLYGKKEARPGRKMGHVTELQPPR
ncbi:MAG: 5-(carboxyamino)imidazole ribonucleotide synthase, partial [Alphaproteobacteria bacterium]|nr:5-(carboxyamino)imidazole ribonucleotide synthase [Alphaproteobacteria bacterium]